MREIAWLLKEKYHGQKNEGFWADCERLAAGEPLAYVIGHVPFLDCTIYLDSKPLIPRPETEFWVEQAILSMRERVAQGSPRQGLGEPWAGVRVLDLCAGSGAIGVAVAKAIPETHVTFAELDATHLSTIEKNLTKNLIVYDKTQYTLVESDLFNQLPADTQYDFILTNPPYIDKVAETVDKNVEAYEPHLALFGGQDGMEVITQIIAGARAKLAPRGQLWIEHEPFQVAAIAELASKYGFSVDTHPDQYATARYSVLTNLVTQ